MTSPSAPLPALTGFAPSHRSPAQASHPDIGRPTRRQRSPLLLLFALLVAFLPAAAQPSGPVVVQLNLDDTIQPISDDYLTRALDRGASLHAQAVLIEMDTPGGLLTSMRDMAGKIGRSPVPVIVYVAPTGARAGSAGFFLLEAADIAAMAPGTNAGAAHPVAEGGKMDDTMKEKITNDAAAFLRSYTAVRGRNPKAAEDAIRQSKSYSAEEMKQLGLIDLIAPDRTALLDRVDGRTVTRLNGEKVTLHTRNAVIVTVTPTLRDTILGRLMNPNLAVLILVLGGLLIYVEFNAPGTIVPGALGTVLVLLALFALNLLPIHYTAAMLVLAAFALMLLEAKFASHGVLGAVGILCLIFGLLTLVPGPVPEMRVHISTAVACGIGFGLITAFLLRIAIQARRNKLQTGTQTMVGEFGTVVEPLLPSGQIFVRGELWEARSPIPLARGDRVRVRAVENLTLLVEPAPLATADSSLGYNP
jgi:membrane-bound serine protease (ClpP class)